TNSSQDHTEGLTCQQQSKQYARSRQQHCRQDQQRLIVVVELRDQHHSHHCQRQREGYAEEGHGFRLLLVGTAEAVVHARSQRVGLEPLLQFSHFLVRNITRRRV